MKHLWKALISPFLFVYYIILQVFIGNYEEELHEQTVHFVTISMCCILGLFSSWVFSKIFHATCHDIITVSLCYLFGAFIAACNERTEENV